MAIRTALFVCALGAVFLAAGCSSPSGNGGSLTTGGSTTTGGGGMCAALMGSYSMTFVERSGNCGPASEQIVVFPPAGPAPNCSGTATGSADNCSMDLDVTCTDTANNVSGRQTGHYNFAADGSGGTGTIQETVRDLQGRIVCSSTYNVTLRKL